jgi:hypothetical protein
MAQIHINAWREILTRIFVDFEVEQNVSPSWLVNPETNRPLKLDLLYSEIGMAIRFAGLRGTQQRGPISLQEKAQLRARDEARTALTEAHGISLAILDVIYSEPPALFEALELAFSRAARRLRQDQILADEEKSGRLNRLQAARIQARTMSREIKTDRDLTPYLDLWRDRQFRQLDQLPGSPDTNAPELPLLTTGMTVEHTHFGSGIISAVSANPDGSNDPLIRIHFAAGEEKSFLLSLLAGKLALK